jgi:serine/threonine-protein kinase
LSAPVREGEILAGKYRVDRVLGVGGMGVVVAAHHINLDEPFAIKFLLPETLKNADAVARFTREARAAAKIKNEHVARVSDVGTLENGAPYMVMEYLEGLDLSEWLAQRGRMPIEQAVDMILQACEAIAEAHALGIIHRDLKPANLFVANRANGRLCVKVLDFGISKSSHLGGAMTSTSALMGSPLYMSPEQMQSSKDVDPRSDIWALGVILYELVTGQAPFNAETLPELVLRIMRAPPPPLRQVIPDAPAALEAVLLRCLDKERSARFASVAELTAALAPFAPRAGAPRSNEAPLRTASSRAVGAFLPSGSSPSVGVSSRGAKASTTAETLAGDPEPHAAGGTMASWGRTAATKGPRSFVLVGSVLAAIVVGVTALLFLRKPAKTDPLAPSSAAATAAPVVAREVKQPEPPPAPQPTATTSTATISSAVPAASVAAPEVTPLGSAAPSVAAAPHLAAHGKIASGKAKSSTRPPATVATPAPAPTKQPAHESPSQPTDEWGGGRL